MPDSASSCPVCGADAPAPLLHLADVPVACNILPARRADALKAAKGEVRLVFCGNCAMIWNSAFREDVVGYSAAYENSLHFSPVFQAYAEELARKLVTRYGLAGANVVELASGKGEFLAMLCDAGVGTAAGFDPSYDGEVDDRVDRARVRLVSREYRPGDGAGADLVCVRHFLEHVHDPRAFLASIVPTLAPGRAVLYLEVPDAGYMLRETGIYDVIYEHCSYFTAPALARLVVDAALDPIEIDTSFGGQYLFAESRRRPGDDSSIRAGSTRAAVAALQSLVPTFTSHAEAAISRAAEQIAADEATGRDVVLWGAGSKGVTFLNVVPGARYVSRVVDVNPRKRGRYVPVTGQPVVAPDELRDAPPDVVLVTNRMYRDEVAASLASLGLAPSVVVV